MKIKTSELSGADLDWAVAQFDPMCNGLTFERVPGGKIGFGIIGGEKTPCAFLSHNSCLSERMRLKRDGVIAYSPSTDWSQCGPLIARYGITLSYFADGYWISNVCEEKALLHGETALIAACRSIVTAKLGDSVEIPDELATA